MIERHGDSYGSSFGGAAAYMAADTHDVSGSMGCAYGCQVYG